MTANFEIQYHPDALKDIKKLDRFTLKRLKSSIEDRLAAAPFDYGKPLRHSAHGLWSLRVGDWRIIYKVEATQVLVLRIGHRREIYKLL